MSKRLFVGGLSWGTGDSALMEAFAQHGEVVDAKVMMDRDTGRSRGFGFVTFDDEEAAKTAQNLMNGQELDGRRLKVDFAADTRGDARPRAPEVERSRRLFVGGLSWNTGDGDLLEAFAEFGEVVDAKVMTDRDSGRSRGFGFVTYDDEETAMAAQKAMNGQELDGRRLKVDLARERAPQRSEDGGRPRPRGADGRDGGSGRGFRGQDAGPPRGGGGDGWGGPQPPSADGENFPFDRDDRRRRERRRRFSDRQDGDSRDAGRRGGRGGRGSRERSGRRRDFEDNDGW